MVTAPGADGQPLSLRLARQNTADLLDSQSDVTFPNPSFATATTSPWATTSGSLARDTTDFDSSPASLNWTPGSTAASHIECAFSGTWSAGTPYIVSFWLKNTAGLQIEVSLRNSAQTILQ